MERSLGEVQYGLFASPAYLAQYQEPKNLEELAQHARLQMNGGAFRGDWLLYRDGKEARIKEPPRLKLNATYGLCDAALLGLGIARLPLWFAESLVANEQLKPVLSQWQPASTPIHAVFPSNRYLAPKVRSFIDFVVEASPSYPALI